MWEVIRGGRKEREQGQRSREEGKASPAHVTNIVHDRASIPPGSPGSYAEATGAVPGEKKAEACVHWRQSPPSFRLCPAVLTLPSGSVSTAHGLPQHWNRAESRHKAVTTKCIWNHRDTPSKMGLKMEVGHDDVAQRLGICYTRYVFLCPAQSLVYWRTSYPGIVGVALRIITFFHINTTSLQ